MCYAQHSEINGIDNASWIRRPNNSLANIRVHNVQYGIANRNDNTRRRRCTRVLYSRKNPRVALPRASSREVKQLGLRSTRRAKLRQGVRIEFSLTVVRVKLSETSRIRNCSSFEPLIRINRSRALLSNYCVYSPCVIDQHWIWHFAPYRSLENTS